VRKNSLSSSFQFSFACLDRAVMTNNGVSVLMCELKEGVCFCFVGVGLDWPLGATLRAICDEEDHQ
jgi:hypothetical protein